MKTATIQELKEELQQIDPERVLELCVKLAKYKKENKELLTYLLFNAADLPAYIEQVKNEMDEEFKSVSTVSVYFAKKNLRRILRSSNKYIRHTGSKQAEAEILIHFCKGMKEAKLSIKKNQVLSNLYHAQLKKIDKALSQLHEDLQYDYQKDIELLHQL